MAVGPGPIPSTRTNWLFRAHPLWWNTLGEGLVLLQLGLPDFDSPQKALPPSEEWMGGEGVVGKGGGGGGRKEGELKWVCKMEKKNKPSNDDNSNSVG